MIQSKPCIRTPMPCGHDDDVARGREPCQIGWYEYAARVIALHQHKTNPDTAYTLDVGSGVSTEGLNHLQTVGTVEGIDVDPRLAGLDFRVRIQAIESVPDKSYDYVTCFDVIEQVPEDLEMLRHLFRVARRLVIVTTPNYTRSLCRNPHHCRELTIPEFLLHYRPDELHVASPDGWLNRLPLLRRTGERNRLLYIRHGGADAGGWNETHLVAGVSFADTTVDGQEWPHMMGVWDVRE